MVIKTQAISDAEQGSTPHVSGLCESLKQGNVTANNSQSSTNALPSLSLMNTVELKHSVLNEIGDWLSREADSSCLNPVPDELGDAFGIAREDCAAESVSSRTADQNPELLHVPRSSSSTPEPEESWIIDEGDVQSCLGNTANMDNQTSVRKEKKERSHRVQGIMGMSLNVMRDYYAIGPEATRKNACYAPVFGYLSKENHQDEECDEGFRFDKKAYLKRFVHEDALVPQQPEYIGRNVLDEAVLWPNDPGSDVPNEGISLEITSPLDFPCESEVEVPGHLDKLYVTSESEPESANLIKAQVPPLVPHDQIRDHPAPDCRTRVGSERFNEVQAQAKTSFDITELKCTFTANPELQQQSRRILGPSQHNESILAPIQLNRSIPELIQHNRNIPGRSKRYKNIPGPSQLNTNIPGPSHGYCYPMDLRDKLIANASKVLRVNATFQQQCQFSSTKPVNRLRVPHIPVFPSRNEVSGQPITDHKPYNVMPQRCNVDLGVEAQFHTPQKQSRPSHVCYPNPKDIRDKLNVRLALRDTAIREKSPVPSNSTILSDTDSSDDEGRPRRRRFMRTVVSPTRRRLFSLSKGIMPQDNLECAEPLKAVTAPKPPVEFEKELNVDEWGEELDYELGSDVEKGSNHTSSELQIINSVQDDSTV